MHSNRRSRDERHSDMRDEQTRESEARRSGHRQRHHRRQDDQERYDIDDRREYSSTSRYVDQGDTRGRSYYGIQNDSYKEARNHEVDNRSEGSHAQQYSEEVREGSRSRHSRKEEAYLAGPSILIKPRESSFGSSPPPVPTSPSPEYVTIAAEPSKAGSSPPRKLIILDLNGTLLVRVRSLGVIHPRPYMPAFRDFLLCPATRKWLDVMIWSSAQPHNVERMVRRCFFDSRLGSPPPEPEQENDGQSEGGEGEGDKWYGKLAAVWARDTLGLSRTDYSRKAQTTKDLEKPWSALPGKHGARTTVLLDDSPRKARLQPFNHLCINEYSMVSRSHDTSIKRRTQKIDAKSESLDDTDHVEEKKDGAASLDGNEKETRDLTEAEKGRRKKKSEKKKKRKAKVDTTVDTESGAPRMTEKYDSTLLAVIGILDALKLESNVAGWIRAGGLWAGKTPPFLDIPMKDQILHEEPAEGAPSPTDLEVNGEEIATRPVSPSQAKRQRSTGGEIGGNVGGDMKRSKFNIKDGAANNEEPVIAGNDMQTVGAVPAAKEPPTAPMDNDIKVAADGSDRENLPAKMWFEDEETFREWVRRGREALSHLGIEERDGIQVD